MARPRRWSQWRAFSPEGPSNRAVHSEATAVALRSHRALGRGTVFGVGRTAGLESGAEEKPLHSPFRTETASRNDSPLRSRTQAMASPDLPHPKHFQCLPSGVFVRLGVRSSWNGQCQKNRFPRRCPSPRSELITASSVQPLCITRANSRAQQINSLVLFQPNLDRFSL